MLSVGIIANFVAYVIREIVIIKLFHMLTDNKVKSVIISIVMVIINSISIALVENKYLLVDNETELHHNYVWLFLGVYAFLGRMIIYILSFRKCNLQIFYLFVLSTATSQIYYNLVTPMINENNMIGVVSCFIEIVILSLFLIYMKKKKKVEVYRQIVVSLPKKLYILVLVMLLIASIFVMAATRDDNIGRIMVKYLLLPSMIGMVISTIAIVRIGISETEKKSAVDLLSKQMEGQIGYYEKINKIYGEFRSFRHDYKNHVLCLRGLIAADKKDEALEYMNTMQDMSSVGKNKYHTGNVIIDALLDDKSDKAEKVRTKLDFEGVVPSSGISNADLCIIMANAIDNAIEACSKDESENEKIIKVDSDFRQGYFFLRVSNPMFEEVKFKGKNKVVTSKADKEHHGFGVANIVHTAEKHGGTADISTDNGQFTIEVQLMLEQSPEEKVVCSVT